MDDDAAPLVFRVTVRGRFFQLTDEARRYLVGAQAEHDVFISAYTVEGMLTYDAKLDFFNFRYELRAGGVDAASTAGAEGMREAEAFLRTMRFGYRDLKVDVVDMSAMWAEVERRPHRARSARGG